MTVRLADAADLEAVIQLERATAEAPHWAESEYAAMLVVASGEVRGDASCCCRGRTSGGWLALPLARS